MDHHTLSYGSRAGTLKTISPLNLHHTKLTAFIHEAEFLVLNRLAITVDHFSRWQLLHRGQVRMGTKMRNIDIRLLSGIQYCLSLRHSNFDFVYLQGCHHKITSGRHRAYGLLCAPY
jgi:hypothetical protein